MNISKDKIVTIDFELKNNNGEILDSSEDNEPLKFLVGHGNIIIGLENALSGKSMGDNFTVIIEPDEAYGHFDEEAIQILPLHHFEDIEDLEEGVELLADTDDGPRPITVTAINDGMVTVDGNHVLAGMTLHFSVTVKDVRDATAEEIDHGHAH